MTNLEINFPGIDYPFPMVFVKGTADAPYLFGETDKAEIKVRDFYISKFPVTQTLWEFIMGSNPAHFKERTRPVECVSFNDITTANGFLDKLNAIYESQEPIKNGMKFRLPTETEWEYAARGGINWKDNFLFSGSNHIEEVGWQGEKHSGTHTHPVGEKLPNQLGIHDMCGNVWEWCQDYFQSDIHSIPKDGSPYLMETEERVLRGGCHHNWAVHCTVSKRYAIDPTAKDECIGFRLAMPV
ncbi:MAG: formylglycine-generating enzyme family protein [Bacteroidota bacterium]